MAGSNELTRSKVLGQDRILYLVCQSYHAVYLVLSLLTLRDQSLELIVHDVLSTKESVDLVLLDREASFHALLACPVLTMGFALDKNLGAYMGSVESMHTQ